MYHFGVIKTLFLQNLLPRVMSGSSAGAIVLAILGVKTSDELRELFTNGTEVIKRDIRLDFFSNKGSLLRKLKRILSKGVIMDIEKLQEAMKANIGDLTFSEAYARTGRIINITVSPGNDFEHARLLNYLTAPNVLVWSAASASCALPGLYESVQLMAKNDRGAIVPYHLSNVTWTGTNFTCFQKLCVLFCRGGCGA
jgi:predicted acylesterase/phospholipase RssA